MWTLHWRLGSPTYRPRFFPSCCINKFLNSKYVVPVLSSPFALPALFLLLQSVFPNSFFFTFSSWGWIIMEGLHDGIGLDLGPNQMPCSMQICSREPNSTCLFLGVLCIRSYGHTAIALKNKMCWTRLHSVTSRFEVGCSQTLLCPLDKEVAEVARNAFSLVPFLVLWEGDQAMIIES